MFGEEEEARIQNSEFKNFDKGSRLKKRRTSMVPRKRKMEKNSVKKKTRSSQEYRQRQ